MRAFQYRTTYSATINEHSEFSETFSTMGLSSSDSKEQIYNWIDEAIETSLHSGRDTCDTAFVIDRADLVGLVVEGMEIVDVVTMYLHQKYSPMGVEWAIVDLDVEIGEGANVPLLPRVETNEA